jgi:hypothetical protein
LLKSYVFILKHHKQFLLQRQLNCYEKQTKHFDPKPNIYASMSHFHSRVQKPGEPISQFLAEINGLAKLCNFDNIEQALLTQTLTGIRDMELKQQILQIPELSYEKCVAKAKLGGEHAEQPQPSRPTSWSREVNLATPPAAAARLWRGAQQTYRWHWQAEHSGLFSL